MSQKHESSIVSYSNSESLKARSELFQTLKNYPGTEEEIERSLGLFVRGSLLARIFAIREVYEKIVDIPGMIFDVGTWRGQTAVVCENLRAILEPLHINRRIAAFDTFEGYQGFSAKDKATALHKDGTYRLSENYEDLLKQILALHEQSNVLGNNSGKHFVIKGNCLKTIPQFFVDHPNEFVALAFFDINSVIPTEEAFEHIYRRLAPGGVMAFWQMTRNTIPAEGMVYADKILNKIPHRLQRAKFYPGLCYLQKI